MGNKLGYPEVDLSGKVAVVTGGNTGIGYETAKGLARLGAHTFIACRSKEKAEEAIEQLRKELGARLQQGEGPSSEGAKVIGGDGEQVKNREGSEEQRKEPKVEYLPLDLSSFQSTTDFVRAFKEKHLPLHILVNNAGMAWIPYTKTSDGFEAVFQINYLSHLLMTLELLPLLVETASQSGDVRIVNVSSYAHETAQPFDPNMLNRTEQNYTRFSGYCSSKLYNVMGSFALQRRLREKNITVSSLHPGTVDTEVAEKGLADHKALVLLTKVALKFVGRKPEAGAATSLNCAVNPDLNSQQHFYYESCRPKQCSPDSRNVEFQEELWRRSLEFLKDHLSPDVVEKYGPNPVGVAPEGEGGVAPAGGDQQEGSGETTLKPSEDPSQTDPKDSGEAPASSGSQQEEGSVEATHKPSEDPSQQTTDPKASSSKEREADTTKSGTQETVQSVEGGDS